MVTARLTIDLDAIAANWARLDRLGPAETGAAVKADAYGLGAVPVARRLAAAGARSFFVALAEEGAAVRQALGAGPRIFVLSGHMAGDAQAIRNLGLIPVLNSAEQLVRHLESLPGHPFAVQLDSGMNRLGMEPDEWAAVRDAALKARPVLLMSHLACADEPRHPMNARQFAAFLAMTEGAGVPRSLAATGGAAGPRLAVRPDPARHRPLRRAAAGGRAAGGAAGPAGDPDPQRRTRRKRGLFRHLDRGGADPGGDRGRGLCRRHPAQPFRARAAVGRALPCPILGRVSMDLIGVDVTALPEVPEALELLGPAQGIDALAEAAGTISYEILTGLGARYRRRYLGAGA